ncbi:hypothetical protein L484_007931 [Morus notabilis]|uniref:Uncharacterized protein n=1 Tax=Morus notabilis TaxID=981085 RepID=W9RC59_9ROSA|nr:hypothetical protein L484_007931 [Morus notabilis]
MLPSRPSAHSIHYRIRPLAIRAGETSAHKRQTTLSHSLPSFHHSLVSRRLPPLGLSPQAFSLTTPRRPSDFSLGRPSRVSSRVL